MLYCPKEHFEKLCRDRDDEMRMNTRLRLIGIWLFLGSGMVALIEFLVIFAAIWIGGEQLKDTAYLVGSLAGLMVIAGIIVINCRTVPEMNPQGVPWSEWKPIEEGKWEWKRIE